jgi:hypothetical protein
MTITTDTKTQHMPDAQELAETTVRLLNALAAFEEATPRSDEVPREGYARIVAERLHGVAWNREVYEFRRDLRSLLGFLPEPQAEVGRAPRSHGRDPLAEQGAGDIVAAGLPRETGSPVSREADYEMGDRHAELHGAARESLRASLRILVGGNQWPEDELHAAFSAALHELVESGEFLAGAGEAATVICRAFSNPDVRQEARRRIHEYFIGGGVGTREGLARHLKRGGLAADDFVVDEVIDGMLAAGEIFDDGMLEGTWKLWHNPSSPDCRQPEADLAG